METPEPGLAAGDRLQLVKAVGGHFGAILTLSWGGLLEKYDIRVPQLIPLAMIEVCRSHGPAEYLEITLPDLWHYLPAFALT